AAGVAAVLFDERAQALNVVPRHVVHDVHHSVGFQITALVLQVFQSPVLGQNRLQFDHGQVTSTFEIAGLVEHIGDAARHARGEIAAGRAENHNDAASHVFTA